MRRALIVAGPTCSGKSALALALAERLGGTVINADSMQVFRELRIVTARPSPADEARVAHRLYGVRPAAEAGGVAWWRQAALAAMDEVPGLPILCGGTGLYLSALTEGLADIPEPSAAARAEARALLEDEGAAAMHARLATQDPVTAARLRPTDGQRIARAWEVWRSTGRGLADWQAQKPAPSGWRYTAVMLDPPRAELRAAIAARFASMLELGAVAEIRALLKLGLDPSLPAMRAQGVPELAAHLRGDMTLDAAAARAVLASGQYTKRQATWFRHRTFAGQSRTRWIHARFTENTQFSEREWDELVSFIRDGG